VEIHLTHDDFMTPQNDLSRLVFLFFFMPSLKAQYLAISFKFF